MKLSVECTLRYNNNNNMYVYCDQKRSRDDGDDAFGKLNNNKTAGGNMKII